MKLNDMTCHIENFECHIILTCHLLSSVIIIYNIIINNIIIISD